MSPQPPALKEVAAFPAEAPLPRTEYFLRPYVYYCPTDDGLLFLDLRRGKYFGLNAEHARELCPFVEGLTAETPRSGRAVSEAGTAAQLVRRGLLTTDKSRGKCAVRTVLASSESVPFDLNRGSGLVVRLHHFVNFLVAFVKATVKLRFQSLETTANQLADKKRNLTVAPTVSETVYEFVRIFRRLRGVFYTADQHCLLDSLVLLEFLARYDTHATWALGIKLRPFLAHSWVQYGDCVLNDTVERVQGFETIFAR